MPSTLPNAPAAQKASPLLAQVYRQYHDPKWIGQDPLSWPRAYESTADREVVAFIASSLAYGNVAQIDRSLRDLFRRTGRSPAKFARNFVPGRSDRALEGFYHRFNDSRDLAALFHIIGQMLRGWGSIEGFWAAAQERSSNRHSDGDGAGDKPGIAARGGKFMDAALALDREAYRPPASQAKRPSLLYLFPNVAGPSACKRFFLFLRWMVRPDDGIDLGLWDCERPADLEFPVDTHILRLGRYIGATDRKDAGAKTRAEITDFFRAIDPEDPVRFDFSFCRIGILKRCPSRDEITLCEPCGLKPACSRYRRIRNPNAREQKATLKGLPKSAAITPRRR